MCILLSLLGNGYAKNVTAATNTHVAIEKNVEPVAFDTVRIV
jgi:hypothetical protein